MPPFDLAVSMNCFFVISLFELSSHARLAVALYHNMCNFLASTPCGRNIVEKVLSISLDFGLIRSVVGRGRILVRKLFLYGITEEFKVKKEPGVTSKERLYNY